jgi:hypothetical protein
MEETTETQTCPICWHPLTDEPAQTLSCANCEAEAEGLDSAFFGEWGD